MIQNFTIVYVGIYVHLSVQNAKSLTTEVQQKAIIPVAN